MRPAVWKAGMLCKFKSLGYRADHWFEARILRVREKYAIVRDERGGKPIHVALPRLETRKVEYRYSIPAPDGPRCA